MSGVVAAITATETNGARTGRAVQDYPILAGDEVLFVGQPVVALAAEDSATAAAAARAVIVEYEVLEPYFDVDDVIAASTPLLHPNYESYTGAVVDRPSPNAQGVWRVERGDLKAEMDTADTVLNEEYTVGRSAAATMETHACTISVEGPSVAVWATTKEPFSVRRQIAEYAGIDADAVVVNVLPLGGDFGSKGFPFLELACFELSRRCGRPVHHRLDMAAELGTTSARHPARIALRTAVRGGRITAVHAETTLDGGAFAAMKAAPMAVVPVIGAPLGSYAIAARLDNCVSYYTNTLPGGHVRSPGEFQALFAGESHVDTIAHQLGIDPFDLRMHNARDERVRTVLQRTREIQDRWSADRQLDSGLGMALCFRDSGPGMTTARCTVDVDRGVVVDIAVPDQGAGAYELFRRLVSESLAVRPERVTISVQPAGRDSALADSGAGASRVTAVAGSAIVDACRNVRASLIPPESESDESIDELLRASGRMDASALGTASAGWPAPPGVDVRSHGSVVVELSVDRETGEVRLHRAAVVADTGRVVNPVGHRGQLEGGFVYGLSQTLYENLVSIDGRIATTSLRNYHLASIDQVPPLEVHVIAPADESAADVLSVGELTNVGVAPAIGNAIFDATGVRMRSLPITPERMLTALAGGNAPPQES
jgi:CO/xanthine dehydrogenase Mo-binding subunit